MLTAFLASGKTTLLNRILTENHGKRIAVIENEFGEIGIDQGLVFGAHEETFEMNNGCICCTVRGDLIRIIGDLMRRRERFDYILVETTGMAHPGPVAQTFFMDDEIKGSTRLDGIVTMVDAKHVWQHIDDSNEAKAQVAFADVILLNKTDLVDAADLNRLERKIRAINGGAKVYRCPGRRGGRGAGAGRRRLRPRPRSRRQRIVSRGGVSVRMDRCVSALSRRVSPCASAGPRSGDLHRYRADRRRG